MNDRGLISRARFLGLLGVGLAAVSGVLLTGLAVRTGAAAEPTKIGIVGAGKMGGALAELWAKAGHEVMISSRHPDELKAQAQAIGPNVHVGTVREAAAFGPVVLIAMPYGKWPEIGDEIKSLTVGKTVIDLTNPYPDRDGPMAEQARKETTGVANPRYLPGAYLVRAFNSIIYTDLHSQAHRAGEPAAIAVAGDDAHAVDVTSQLVRDAGFEPVMVGPLSSARLFDVGTPVYVKVMTAVELRKALGLPAH
jgi:8-hydroxy-5-deazaflavin:NADPH oxidoreductase